MIPVASWSPVERRQPAAGSAGAESESTALSMWSSEVGASTDANHLRCRRMGREGVIPLCPRGRAATITRLTGQGPVAAPQGRAAWSTLSLTAHHCPRPGRGAWRTLRRTHGTSSSHTMPVMSHGSLMSARA